MTTIGPFDYKYGLSFPGEKREGWVDELAQKLVDNCYGDQSKVLYDLFHQGVFARSGLEDYMPEEYCKCELIIVFLCKEYANKNWCRKEWKVVQRLARDKDQRHRVMYLWLGELEEAVLQELGLNWDEDGLAQVDSLKPDEIKSLVFQRYLKNEKDIEEAQLIKAQLVASQPLVLSLAQPGSVQSDGYWRLLVVVSEIKADDPAASGDRFQVLVWLMRPDGQAVDDLKLQASTRDHAFSFDQLAGAIVELFSSAATLAVEQSSRSDAAALDAAADAAADAAEALLVLVLPAALIASDRLQRLLRQVRQCCQADPGQDEEEERPPPIVLACAERLNARVQSSLSHQDPRASKTQRAWQSSFTIADRVSREIIKNSATDRGLLGRLNWLLVDEVAEVADENHGQSNHVPQAFAQAPERVRTGRDLEETAFRLARQGPKADHDPQSLYLRWKSDLHEKEPDRYQKRMNRILKAGIPLFLKECPELRASPAELQASPPQASEPAAASHPFDRLLQWNHAKLIQNFRYFHHEFQPPSARDQPTEQGVLGDYIRNSILFWDDYRFRPPCGAASGQPPEQTRTDAWGCPFH